MGVLRRQPGIALFTAVEVAGLAVWLALARGSLGPDPIESFGVRIPAAALGLAVLFVALFVEHRLTDATVNGVQASGPTVGGLAVTATETALWAIWLAVAEAVGGLVGVIAAGAILLVLLVPQHTVEDNGLRRRGLRSDLVSVGTVGFSAVEALGATVWLALVVDGSLLGRLAAVPGMDPGLAGVAASANPEVAGLAVLAILLFVEHNMGVRFAGRVAGAGERVPGDQRVTRI